MTKPLNRIQLAARRRERISREIRKHLAKLDQARVPEPEPVAGAGYDFTRLNLGACRESILAEMEAKGLRTV